MRVGVLGAGAISQIVYLPILSEREDVELRVLSDADPHKARTLAERFDVPRVGTEDEVLKDPELDAVVIATPNHLHEQQGIAALGAGKHVLVERPLALEAEGVARMQEAAERAQRSVVVGMAHRYRPEVSALASFVASGELGRVYAERGAWLNRSAPQQRRTWRWRRAEAGGGALVDLGVPALDLCLWLVGYPQIARVKAVLMFADAEVEEAAVLMVETVDGMALTAEMSWGYFAAEDYQYARVMGTEGSGSLPPLQIFKQLGGRPLDVTPRQPLPRGGEDSYTNAYRREIDHFVRVVAGQSEAPFPAEQAILMELVQAAYRSAEEAREIELR